MVTNLFLFLILTESIVICGQLGKYEMDGATLANSFVNIGGIAFAVGFCTACDTFFSQIFGSKHRKYLGMMLQRSLLIVIILPLLLIPLHLNWKPLLLALHQDPLVVEYTSLYLTLFAPGFIFLFLNLVLNRYLQNQYYVMVPMFTILLVNIFNISSQYIFVIFLGYGFQASPICQAISYFLSFLLQALFIFFSGIYKKTWTGFTREAFLDWGKFFAIAIPGIGVIFFEVASWEINTFLSGVLGTVALGAQSVLFQYDTSLFQACFALGVAVNIRVGEALGLNYWKRALTTYRVGLLISVIFGVLSLIFLLSIKDLAVKLFTSDQEIIILATDTFPLMVSSQTLDFLSSVTLGALRGCGKQKLSILLVLIGFYLFGQPIGITLAFLTPLGIKGIWIGNFAALSTSFLIGFIYTNFIQDWSLQAHLAQDRISGNLNVKESMEQENSYGIKEKTIRDHHKRTSSTSFTPSTNPKGTIKATTIFVSEEEYRHVYMLRALFYGIVVLIFFVGILVRLYVPVSTIDLVTNFNGTTTNGH